MSYVNRVTLIGNVVRDPEIKMTASGKSVANFTVATNEFWKDAQGETQSDAEYHSCVSWAQQADIVEKYFRAGLKVYVEGRIKTSTYEKDGEKRKNTQIVTSRNITLTQEPEVENDRAKF